MGEEIVEVTIGPDGRVTVEVQGVAGLGCLDAYVEHEQSEVAHQRQGNGRS